MAERSSRVSHDHTVHASTTSVQNRL